MKTTNMKRIMACLLAALTVTAVSSTTAFAASTTQNSSGSTVAENMDGKDTTQDKKTVYSGEITADSTEEVKVYATQASTFSVKIPKVIILDGQAGTAKYQVSVKGNINGEEMIKVVPTASFKMSQSGKADITATTTQTVQNFVNTTLAEHLNKSHMNGVKPDAFITTEGDVSVAGMTAGSWAGTTNFNISLTDTDGDFGE